MASTGAAESELTLVRKVRGDLEDDLRSDEGGGSIREFTGFPVNTATSISRGTAADRRLGGRPASVPHISAAFGSPARGGGCRFAAPRNVLADQLNPVNRSGQRCPCLFIKGALMTLSLIHISEPTRRTPISYAVFCLK